MTTYTSDLMMKLYRCTNRTRSMVQYSWLLDQLDESGTPEDVSRNHHDQELIWEILFGDGKWLNR